MNARQNNKLVSYLATQAALEAIPEIDRIPGLPAELAIFQTKMREMLDLAQTQKEVVAGKRARRDELLEAMAETAVDVATSVAAYADKHRLTELAPRVRVTAADFARMRKAARPVLARTILDAAHAVLPELGSYGVTAEMLERLQARIAAALDGLHQPRTSIVERKTATGRMLQLVDEIDELLRSQIDRLVYAIRKAHPQAYASYRSARAIIDRSRSGRSTPAPAAKAAAGATASTPASEQRAA